MTRRNSFASAAVAALALTLLSRDAAATTDGRLRVEILVDGRPVQEYASRGATYVEALRSREYAIRLTNQEPVRVAVALAVDGRNTIDGRRTTAREGRKWILDPWQSITVSGWQVDDSRARHFLFTTKDRSYADWLGDTSNVGVIEAVSFRERWHEHHATTGGGDRGWGEDDREEPTWQRQGSARSKSGASNPAEAPSPSGTVGGVVQGAEPAAPSAQRDSASRRQSEESRDEAATGAGRDVRHDVVRVRFEHEDWASSQLRIRYEFREQLISMGIMPRDDWRHDGWRRREQASGFSDGPWCPEPPRRW